MPEKISDNKNEYHQSEISLIDSIERTKFKMERHSLLNIDETLKNFSLIKPEETEKLIDEYFFRKSYRKYTNEIVEKSDIEHLFKNEYDFTFRDRKQFWNALQEIV